MLGFSGLILTKMLNHMARDMQFPGFQAVDPVEVVRFQIIIHLFQRIAQLFARQAKLLLKLRPRDAGIVHNGIQHCNHAFIHSHVDSPAIKSLAAAPAARHEHETQN